MGNDTRNKLSPQKTPPRKYRLAKRGHPPQNIDLSNEVTLPKTSTCQTRSAPPQKHQLAKRGQPPPKTSAQTCLGSSLRRPHTHYYYDNPSLQKRKSKTRISALRFRTIPYILNSHSQHTVLMFGIFGENSFILEIAPLVTLPLRSCAPHRQQRASVRFRLRISGHKTTPQNKCYRRAPLGEQNPLFRGEIAYLGAKFLFSTDAKRHF